MSHTISIEKAAATLSDLVGKLKPGDEIVLTSHDHPVARILPSQSVRSHRKAGRCKGMLVIHSEDKEHLKDFSEYMP